MTDLAAKRPAGHEWTALAQVYNTRLPYGRQFRLDVLTGADHAIYIGKKGRVTMVVDLEHGVSIGPYLHTGTTSYLV